MKKLFVLISVMAFMAFSVFAQNTNTAKTTKTPKTMKAAKIVPTDDASVQKCISDKFATQPKMKTYGLSATVSGGVATLTGTVPSGGAKGNAKQTATRCGAKSVTDNITVTAKTKTPKTPKTAKAANATK